MLVSLDTVIVIYAIEGDPPLEARARARLASLRSAGNGLVVSDLTWLKWCVLPVRRVDSALLARYHRFLNPADVSRLSLPSADFDRATILRAFHRYQLADALHLAVAIEGRCDLFLTNDHRLGGFPALTVEVLP